MARGIRVGVGHTEADFDLTRAALDRGATLLTHALNAMPGIGHREPGPVPAALAHDGVTLERSRDETDPVWMGALWECPQFVTVDGVEVMISSVWEADVLHYAGYATGSYADNVVVFAS